MAYYEQRPNPDKPEEMIFVEVEASKLELPDDELGKRVVAHPKYREVLDESKGRKSKIKELREALTALEGQPEEDGVAPEKVEGQQSPAAAPVDTEALYNEFRKRFIQDQQAETSAQTAEKTRLAGIAAKHGLSADALPLLENAKDPEALAATLVKSNYRFDEVSGGAPSKPDADALKANVFKNLGLEGD